VLPLPALLAVLTATATAPASPTGEAVGRRGPRLEIGALPVVAFDSNIGLGFGAIGNLASVEAGVVPYHWRLQAQAYVTVKSGPDGLELPFQHHYLILDHPRAGVDALRLRLTARFRRQRNVGYYGLGNASRVEVRPADLPEDAPQAQREAAFRFHQYDRIFPNLRLDARLELGGAWEAFAGIGGVWNRIEVYPGSALARDLAAPDPVGRPIGDQEHGLAELLVGVVYDSRDDEITPSRGGFHELSLRGARTVAMSAAFAQLNGTARYFLALGTPRLVLAGRLMADLLVGDVPFYELTAHGGLFPDDAVAGSRAIRGPPSQRWGGKLKLLGNLELRFKALDFRLFGLDSNLGGLAFFDTGRVWSEPGGDPALDGAGLGLKYGTGGGLRLQWGATFVIRGDVGWSPDGLGIFLSVDHIF
jgi:outer membrane protein assembly factor BamA